MKRHDALRRIITGVAAVLVAFAVIAGWGPAGGPVAPALAQQQGNVPGGALGNISDTELWRAVRKGVSGPVSIPDKKAGQLVQSDGDNWRAFKNGPLAQFGGWLLLFTIVVIALFRLLHGKFMIDPHADPEGRTLERFNALERFSHWLTASSFIFLGLTGLNLAYGRYVLKPILGDQTFATVTNYASIAHHYVGFAFMIGMVLIVVLWVRHNIPNVNDLRWLAVGGGLFHQHRHPPAAKFNAGQKIIFWVVVLGGTSLAISGVTLMFPFDFEPWAPTFRFLNMFGFDLPTELSTLQETQLSVLWHSVMSTVMICFIIAHIYIGTPLGMEGAFDAVGSGMVDRNWAIEHHSLWVEEVEAAERQQAEASGAEAQPAE